MKELSITHGSITKNILRFIFPLMITNLLQNFYSVADAIVVSMSGEADAVGAIGTTGPMTNLIINICIGCAVGTKVIAAKAIGAKDKEKVQSTLHTSIMLSIVFGIACSVIGILISPYVLKAMKNEAKLLELANRYAITYFSGTVFISVTNFASAVFHAKADTKTPLKVLSLCGMINVVLNLFFVLVLKMTVDGVALATVISNAFSAIWLIWCLTKNDDMCRLNLKKLKIEKESLFDILHFGVPAAIQGALFSLSHMVVQLSIVSVNNKLAPPNAGFAPVVKGSAAVVNIEGFGYIIINAVTQAAITFTGQNVGANQYNQVKKVLYSCYFISFIMSTLFAAAVLILKDPILSLFGVYNAKPGSLDYIAYNTAKTRLLYVFMPYFLGAFQEIGSGTMQGLGKAFTATAISLAGAVAFRIIWMFTVFKVWQTLEAVFLVYPITWLLPAVAHFICITIILKKKNALQNKDVILES